MRMRSVQCKLCTDAGIGFTDFSFRQKIAQSERRTVLAKVSIEIAVLRNKLQELLDTGSDSQATEVPPRPEFDRVVEYAIQESRQLNHNYVGTEHLLLGVLNLHEHAAMRVLHEIGVD